MKKLIAIIIAVSIISIGIFGVARAASSSSDLAADQKVSGPYIRSAETVTIRGTVDGDVIVAGSDVTIEGTVLGSVYAAGSKVTVRGVVRGNVHAAGSDVQYSAREAGSVFLAASSVKILSDAQQKNLFVAASDITVDGSVGSNAYLAGSQVKYGAKTGGDVSIAAGAITVTSGATIGGNLKYTSEQPATIENDRSIAGSINRVQPQERSAAEKFWASLLDLLYWLAANILIAAVVLWGAPKLIVPAEKAFMARPLNSYLKAFAFVFLVPVGLLFGLLSVVGIPLMMILGLAYVLTLVVAPVASAYFVGGWASDRLKLKQPTKSSYQAQLIRTSLGFTLLAAVGLVPILGPLVTLTVYFLGVSIILSRGLSPMGGIGASVSSTPGRSKTR